MLTRILIRWLMTDDLIPIWIIGFIVIAVVRPIVLSALAFVIIFDLTVLMIRLFMAVGRKSYKTLTYTAPAPLPRLPPVVLPTRAERMRRAASVAKDEYVEMVEILKEQPLDEDEREIFLLLEKQRLIEKLEDMRGK